jgi:hypothetical protein
VNAGVAVVVVDVDAVVHDDRVVAAAAAAPAPAIAAVAVPRIVGFIRRERDPADVAVTEADPE